MICRHKSKKEMTNRIVYQESRQSLFLRYFILLIISLVGLYYRATLFLFLFCYAIYEIISVGFIRKDELELLVKNESSLQSSFKN